MNKTSIEWTDFTVNPFRFRNLETGKVGHHCDKISPGCKNCYSSTMQAGPYLSGLTFIAENKPKGELFLDEGVLQQVLRRKKPCRIFWCDMTDMFLADYPDEWIDRCFAVMALTPQHTHQVLTKRADRMRAYFATSPNPRELPTRKHVIEETIRTEHLGDGEHVGCIDWPLPNVHLGVSVENQEYADKRIPDLLLAIPAAVRFVSYEPALGPVDFRPFFSPGWDIPGLDQIIIGGESGPGARPFDIAWARNTIAQCKSAGVACFVKQLGAKPWDSATGKTDHLFSHCGHACECCDECPSNDGQVDRDKHPQLLRLKDKKGGDMSEWPEDLRVREMPEVAR